MTIVPINKIDKDVRKLPYFYPSLSLVKYSKMSSEYHYWRAVSMLEQAARQNGKALVPAACFHWKRKNTLRDFHITVYGRSFYQVDFDELTDNELFKYSLIIQERNKDNEDTQNEAATENTYINNII